MEGNREFVGEEAVSILYLILAFVLVFYDFTQRCFKGNYRGDPELGIIFVPDFWRVSDFRGINKPRNSSCVPKDLCVTFISCNRPHLLKRNFRRTIHHLNTIEPWLCYELIWVDQATPDRYKYSEAYDFHKRLLVDKKKGYAFAFNNAYSLCEAPYMLVLEEDLVLRDDVNWPIISHTIELLERFPHEVYGIVMRPIFKDDDTIMIGYNGTTKYAEMMAWGLKRRIYQWNNGGVIVRSKNVHEMLERKRYISEDDFGDLAKEMGFYYAILDWRMNNGPPKERDVITWFFDHLASDYSQSTIKSPGCTGESYS